MTGQTSKVSAPVWTFPGSWRMSASQEVNYRGSFGIFLICPKLVEDSKTGIHQATMAKIKLWTERLDDFTIKNCFVSPHHDGRNGIKYNLVGLPSIKILINRYGRVSKAVLGSKTMDDLANMMEWGTLGNDPALNNHQPQKSLTPKGHFQ